MDVPDFNMVQSWKKTRNRKKTCREHRKNKQPCCKLNVVTAHNSLEKDLSGRNFSERPKTLSGFPESICVNWSSTCESASKHHTRYYIHVLLRYTLFEHIYRMVQKMAQSWQHLNFATLHHRVMWFVRHKQFLSKYFDKNRTTLWRKVAKLWCRKLCAVFFSFYSTL